jgi:hypothetical protein
MNLSHITGEIEVFVRDIETDELAYTIKQKNIITDYATLRHFWIHSLGLAQTGIGIANGQKVPVPGWAPSATYPFPWYAIGYVPSGKTYLTWGEPAAPYTWFGQMYSRFDPPTATRTINTIFLEWGVSQGSSSGAQSSTGLIGYVSLTTPCTQTTTQYLDVYYKVYFPTTNDTPLSANAYRELIRNMAFSQGNIGVGRGPATVYAISPLPTAQQPNLVDAAGNPVDTNINLFTFPASQYPWSSNSAFANYGSALSYLNSAPGPVVDYDYGIVTQSYSFGTTSNIGQLMGYNNTGLYVVNGSGGTLLTTSSLPIRKNSTIQNVFRHASTSNMPFLDVSNLATSLGNVVPSGSWTTQTLPEMYSVNIVTGGPVGTATYTYSKRKVFHFSGNVYEYTGTPIPNFMTDNVSFLMPDPLVPQLNPLTKITDYNHRLSCSKAINTHSFVMVFTDHVIAHDVLTNISTVYSAATHPTFAPTDITQIETDSLGNIWVACRNTGLYKINGSTITTYGTAQGLPSNTCFGVHLGKPNGSTVKIWAVFNGSIASATSADGFTAWTQYNSTTTPAFTFVGVSDSNWNTVEYIRVDPQTDNMLLVRSPTAVTPTNVGVWWSTTTSAVALTIPTNATLVMGDFRVHRQLLNVSENSSFWVVIVADSSGKASHQQLTFGSSVTTVLFALNPYEPGLISVKFEYNYVTGIDNLLVIEPVASRNGYNTDGVHVPRGFVAIPPGGPAPAVITTLSQSNVTPSVGYEGDGFMETRWWVNSSTASPSTSANDIYTFFRMDRGVWISVWVGATGSSGTYNGINYTVAQNQATIWAAFGLDNTASGGPYAFSAVENYGWNGTAWVLGGTGAATTSATPALLENGISVEFTDGSPSTQSFVAGDYFNFVVCDGIMKDNVSTVAFNTVNYLKPVKYNQTALPATVPGSTTAITAATVQTAYSQVSSGVTINGSNQVVLTGNQGDFAVMDLAFTGNFDFTIDFTSLPAPAGAKFGLGNGTRILYGFAVDLADVQYLWSRNSGNGFEGNGAHNNDYNGAALPTQYTPLQTVRFTRTGSTSKTITMYVNGTAVMTDTTAQYVNANVYQLIFRSWLPVGSPITMGAVTVNSADANPPIAKLGTLASTTGAYDPYFFGADYAQPQTYSTITIGGTPVAATHSMFSAVPGIGEISVDPGGWLLFNTADVGKTLGGSYLYIYDPGVV